MNIFTFRRTWHLLFSKTHTGARKCQPINKKKGTIQTAYSYKKGTNMGKEIKIVDKKTI